MQSTTSFLGVPYSRTRQIFWKRGNSILKCSRCSVSVWERAPFTSKGLSMLVIFHCWGQKVLFLYSISALRPLSLARNTGCIKSGRQKNAKRQTCKTGSSKFSDTGFWHIGVCPMNVSQHVIQKRFFINLQRSSKCQNVLFMQHSQETLLNGLPLVWTADEALSTSPEIIK